jgi:hypothetical protein
MRSAPVTIVKLLMVALLLTMLPAAGFGEQVSYQLTPADEALLEDVSRRAFNYFWEQTDESTGLTRDRARVDGSPQIPYLRNVSNIAASGFGLTALAIGAERGWIAPDQARERARAGLSFFAHRAEHQHGWFYHWLDAETGKRIWRSEISSIDTALLLGGILTVRQYFSQDPEIAALATLIYHRIDFPWMLNANRSLFSHGWTPEDGFLPYHWDQYSEHTLLYLLGLASPAHPIPPQAWHAWQRDTNSYAGQSFIGSAPLFTFQYSHAWVDFRGRREQTTGIDYFKNSVTATLAHRAFCRDLSREFASYSDNVWGISASDSLKGYAAWGGPPRDRRIDGTIVPSAAAGSLMFTPEAALAALRTMREKFGDRVYRRYGFRNAFNPVTGWLSEDVIGIEIGITLLSAENLRTGFVWKWFMRNPEVPHAMERAGLRAYEGTLADTKRTGNPAH